MLTSSLGFKGTLSQIIHAAYPIVCFSVLARTFFFFFFFFFLLRKGFFSMHSWYCICAHHWHIEDSLKTALAESLYAKGTRILQSEIYKHYVP